MDHKNIASAVFSQPPVASVGLTEEEARGAGHRVEIYRSSFRALKHTLSGRDERSMMKLIVDAESRKVLGAHMVGGDSAEIIQGVAIASQDGRHQGGLRRHGRHPPDRRRGVRHHARTGPGAGETGGGVGGEALFTDKRRF